MKSLTFGIPQLTKNCNETLILATLKNGKQHGYELAITIENKSQGRFKFNHGTLYPILHKLEKEGLIKGVWKQEGPKRQRKYYALTAKGKKYLDAQAAHWQTFFQHLFNILRETSE